MEYNTSAKGPDIALMNRLTAAAQKADDLLASCDVKPMGCSELITVLKEYVRLRYLLEESDIQEDEHFGYLGEVSLARSLGMPVEMVRKTEMDSKCEGTSSSMTKKILLILSLGKALGIQTCPERNAEVTTVTELAEYVYELLQERNGE